MAQVLVVDDTVDTREALVESLRRAGHDAEGAADGRAGLAEIIRKTRDLVILDLFMPDMDGLGLLEVMRSYLRLQNLPVIVLTAFPESPLVERVQRLHVNRVLAKSKVTMPEIVAAVDQELRGGPPD